MKDRDDAYGREIRDYFNGKEGFEVAERDDESITPSGGPRTYFRSMRNGPLTRKEQRYAKGRVLDLGCGAGRHSLYLQKKAFDALGSISTSLLTHPDRPTQKHRKSTSILSS